MASRNYDVSEAKTPDQGAQTPVLLAIGDIGGNTGLFWRDEQVQNFETYNFDAIKAKE
jgi:hypothetical protein